MSILIVIVYLVAIIGLLFLADAAVGLFRAIRGFDEEAISRRMQPSPDGSQWLSQRLFLMRTDENARGLNFIPLSAQLKKLIEQSGLNWRAPIVLVSMGAISFVVLVVLLYFLPVRFSWIAILIAPAIGIGPMLAVIFRARTLRRQKFSEQLPDALDLIVRSLKIGHPFSEAMNVIARDMPPPIREEFSLAYEQVNFGRDVSSTLVEMTRRMGSSDLSYVAMAVQIQQESGGNLVESLSKLADVVRDRFRMFRKVKAITAEGRFSAWMLSLFPIGLIAAIQAVKPDYYTQVMDYPYFPYLVGVVVVMLILNVIAMRVLTTLEV